MSSSSPSLAGSACPTLLECFSKLPDRRKPRGLQHPLPAILSLCLVALLNGCKNPTQIFVFGKSRAGLLSRLGFRPPKQRRGPKPEGGISCPNEDTIAATLRRVTPDEFNSCIGAWLAGQLPARVEAACDGKALRGTEEHVLEILVNKLCLVVWQFPVGEKENELSALEAKLAAILAAFPQLKLLTGDAMFCHKSIARILVEARRHYLLQLKSPHKTDVEIARYAMWQLAKSTAPLASATEKRGALTVP